MESLDNVLKTGKVEFCAFLSWVVVSSFIETRRNFFFFPEVITDPKRNYERYDVTN